MRWTSPRRRPSERSSRRSSSGSRSARGKRPSPCRFIRRFRFPDARLCASSARVSPPLSVISRSASTQTALAFRLRASHYPHVINKKGALPPKGNEDYARNQPKGRRGQDHHRHQPGELLRGRADSGNAHGLRPARVELELVTAALAASEPHPCIEIGRASCRE